MEPFFGGLGLGPVFEPDAPDRPAEATSSRIAALWRRLRVLLGGARR